MGYPQQIRWLFKWLALFVLLVVMLLGVAFFRLRARAVDAQRAYDSVAVGDSWQGLPGYRERVPHTDPDSAPDGQKRYWRVVRTPYLPLVWEITVDKNGTVIAKHRYD